MRTTLFNFQKSLSIFMTCMLTIICICNFSVNTEKVTASTTNSSREYRIFDAITGQPITGDNLDREDYVLSTLGTSMNQKFVFGEDERTIDWTKSGTVKLMNSTSYRGTGFVVDSHTIATGAHCVYNVANNIAHTLTEILLFNSDGTIALHATPVEIHAPVDYAINAYAYDYALVTVEEDLSDYATFNLGIALDSFSAGSSVAVTGFPQGVNNVNVNNNTLHTMYSGSGEYTHNDIYRLFYYADETEGNSGSPVYITETRLDKTYYTVIGINVSGISQNGVPLYNSAIRINTDLIHFYCNNPNLSWE